MRTFKTTNYRAILSGDILEFYYYQKPIAYGFEQTVKRSHFSREKTEAEKLEIKKRSIHRTRGNLRRLINSNNRQLFDNNEEIQVPKFVTLTFEENIQDLTSANKIYTKFIKRFNYKIFGVKESKLKYTVVPEFQKRGAVHYHVIFYNLPWFDSNLLAEIWNQGFIKIKDISEVDNVGAYMTKYMSKDALDKRLDGRKRYFSSRKLVRPVMDKNHERMSKLDQILSPYSEKFKTEFKSEYLGLVKYKSFNLSENLLLKENVLDYLNKR